MAAPLPKESGVTIGTAYSDVRKVGTAQALHRSDTAPPNKHRHQSAPKVGVGYYAKTVIELGTICPISYKAKPRSSFPS